MRLSNVIRILVDLQIAAVAHQELVGEHLHCLLHREYAPKICLKIHFDFPHRQHRTIVHELTGVFEMKATIFTIYLNSEVSLKNLETHCSVI